MQFVSIHLVDCVKSASSWTTDWFTQPSIQSVVCVRFQIYLRVIRWLVWLYNLSFWICYLILKCLFCVYLFMLFYEAVQNASLTFSGVSLQLPCVGSMSFIWCDLLLLFSFMLPKFNTWSLIFWTENVTAVESVHVRQISALVNCVIFSTVHSCVLELGWIDADHLL